MLARYKKERRKFGRAAELMQKMADAIAVAIFAPLRQFKDLFRYADVMERVQCLLGCGAVPFTTCAVTENFESHPHRDNKDLACNCICVWLPDGECLQYCGLHIFDNIGHIARPMILMSSCMCRQSSLSNGWKLLVRRVGDPSEGNAGRSSFL